MSRRAGFSLVELLVAMVAGLLVMTVFARLADRVLWHARARGERAGEISTIRIGATLLGRELDQGGVDSLAGPDLAVAGGSITYRAPRGVRFSCRVAVDTIVVAADTAADWSSRAPAPGRDSLLLYLPGDSASAIDAWLPLPLTATRTGVCPLGNPALALITVLDSTAILGRRIPPETAVRVFESVELRGYGTALGWQLGVEERSAGALIQPVAGPLLPGGFLVRPLDSAGGPAGRPSDVAALDVTLRASPARWLAAALGSRGLLAHDSVRVEIAVGRR